MRLLHCSTKTLRVFIGSDVRPYAILSHTWEDDEVVHEGFINDAVDHTKKAGWYKIEKACDQALQDGLEYLWADTLCIDKASSSELSEAINSMFRWYRDSAICYAFLSDLPDVPLAQSRWFTRGWTLQEMIAPTEIKFFNKSWVFQGAKSSLVDQLHQITKVDQLALLGGKLRLFSVATKMSWAAKRRTTRAEDITYCLLGLFDISMPMLYGEGNRAFIRLQEEIVKRYDDQSLFAWTWDTSVAPVAKYSGLFARSPNDFADSGDIARVTNPNSTEPVWPTSRGLRMVTYLRRSHQRDLNIFLLSLNCRRLHFDLTSNERLAIWVIQRQSDFPVYLRIRADELRSFMERQGPLFSMTIFCPQEKHMDELEFAGHYVFWVRTVPLNLRLIAALPASEWDEQQRMFRIEKRSATRDHGPVYLILQSTESASSADKGAQRYFVVMWGYGDFIPRSQAEDNPFIFCDVQARSFSNAPISNNDWALQIQNLNLETPPGGWHRVSSAELDGLRLKCYTLLEYTNGQPIIIADLYVKKEDSAALREY